MVAIGDWLSDADERVVLRGILAAGAVGATALTDAVEAHRHHPRRAVAEAAQRAYVTLDDSAHAEALAAADRLREQLTPLLLALAVGPGRHAQLATLRPLDADYAQIFLAEVVDDARAAYEAAWAEAPTLGPAASPACRVDIHVATAGLLGSDNELSWAFPGGYRGIAPLLQPHRVWAAWKVLEPGQSAGTAYDGLAWVEDHWAWFPRPYRVLRHLVPGG